MKKIILILISLFFCFSCKNEKNKQDQTPIEDTKAFIKNQERFCYLSVSGNNKIKDSVILNIRMTKDGVKGIYEWIPSEKDARRGSIIGKKVAANTIEGEYIFTQEGKTETQPIIIKMSENFAEVITDPKQDTEMKLTIKEVECK